uniref:Uncharacterized protein n=1 Tax=Anguilla anguilla TaxID=7936 RepID=A0A0E9WJS1_ANGAN
MHFFCIVDPNTILRHLKKTHHKREVFKSNSWADSLHILCRVNAQASYFKCFLHQQFCLIG